MTTIMSTRPFARFYGRAVLAAALMLGLSACTGETPATEPSATGPAVSTSPTASIDDAESAELLALYNDYREFLIKVQATTDVAAARDQLGNYTVDPLKSQIMLDLRQRETAKLHNTGRPKWSAEVIKIDTSKKPYKATIEDCFDSTDYELVDANGKPAGVPNQAKKYVVTTTATVYGDGRWYLQTAQADRERTC